MTVNRARTTDDATRRVRSITTTKGARVPRPEQTKCVRDGTGQAAAVVFFLCCVCVCVVFISLKSETSADHPDVDASHTLSHRDCSGSLSCVDRVAHDTGTHARAQVIEVMSIQWGARWLSYCCVRANAGVTRVLACVYVCEHRLRVNHRVIDVRTSQTKWIGRQFG